MAATLSLALPGAGHFLVGRYRRGGVLLVVSGMLIGAVTWAASLSAVEIAALLTRPNVLQVGMAINAALLLFRGLAAVDAYLCGVRPARAGDVSRPRVGAVWAVLAVLALASFAAVPHAIAGLYTWRMQSLLESVFVEDPPAVAATPDPVPPTTGEDTPSAPLVDPDEPADEPEAPDDPADDAAADDVGDDDDDDLDDDEPEDTPNPWSSRERLTIALLGSDAGPGRSGARLDSLMVATVDMQSGALAIFSVDRYLTAFPLSERLASTYEEHCPYGEGWQYINALYTCGAQRVPEAFAALYPEQSDPAAAAVAETLGVLLGLPVDYYALVDMAGFVEVIDTIGGVEVEVTRPIDVELSPAAAGDGWRTFSIEPGLRRLDGQEALAFVRSRQGTGDRDRMVRQRCLIGSLASNTSPVDLLLQFPRIADAIEGNVATNVPISLLPSLLELHQLVDTEGFVALGLGPPTYRAADHVPDVDLIQEHVRRALEQPEEFVGGGSGAELGEEVCR